MTSLPEITEEQLTQVSILAVNDETRELARTGCELSYEQADELGEEAIDWLTSRLGLRVTETDSGVRCEVADAASNES